MTALHFPDSQGSPAHAGIDGGGAMLEWNGEQIMAALLEAIIEGGNEVQAIAVAEAQGRVGYQSGELRDRQ